VHSRRALLAALPAALAGCGARLRNNPVPGGLVVENATGAARTATVRATPLPASTETPTPREEPPGRAPAAETEVTVGAGGRRSVPDFFPSGGTYRVDAVAGERGATLVVRMYPAAPGPAGVDTVFVEFVGEGAVRLSVSTVD